MRATSLSIPGIAAAAVLVLVLEAGGSSGVDVRGCRERVEGRGIVPDPKVDTVIGPMAFIGLSGVYRDYASRPDSELQSYSEDGFTGMKSIGVLRAGARVRLVVPREQRRWLKVIYDYPDHRGGHAIALRACRRLDSRAARRRECGWRPRLACRWRYTQFNGGFGLDFVNAPRRGLCAELIVRVGGSGRTVRGRLFQPPPSGSPCPSRRG